MEFDKIPKPGTLMRKIECREHPGGVKVARLPRYNTCACCIHRLMMVERMIECGCLMQVKGFRKIRGSRQARTVV